MIFVIYAWIKIPQLWTRPGDDPGLAFIVYFALLSIIAGPVLFGLGAAIYGSIKELKYYL